MASRLGRRLDHRMMSLQAESALAPDIPVDATPRCQRAGHVLTKPVLERGPPRDELKPHSVIDHSEPAGGQGDSLAIDAGDELAFAGRPVGKPSLSR